MAVSVTQDTIKMTAEDDSITIALKVQSVRFFRESGNSDTDIIILTDPVSGGELWRTYAGAANSVEAQLKSTWKGGLVWPNGVTLSALPSDNGQVFIQYA